MFAAVAGVVLARASTAPAQVAGAPAPRRPAQVRLVDSGPGFVRVLFQASPEGLPGPPWSPAALRHFTAATLVGVPLTGPVHLQVIAARSPGRVDGEVPPDLRLTGPAWLEAPAFLRQQRVVGLGFGPAADGQGAVVFDRVLVEVRFDPDPGRAPRRDAFESSYRATLLNERQARRWRARRIRTHAAPRPLQAQGLLPEDGMFRITVRSDGIYRVTGADLAAAGADLEAVDPARIRLLYGGGEALGLSRVVSPGLWLDEIAVVVEDGGDGRFDAGDAILFYGEAPERWDWQPRTGYRWRRNLHTRDNAYFLELDAPASGLRAATRSGALSGAAAGTVTQYRERRHEEDERFILLQLLGINSGYEWYWDTFNGNARNFTFAVNDAVPGLPAHVAVRFFGWTDAVHRFDLRWNDEDLGRFRFSGTAARTLRATVAAGAVQGLNQLGLVHRDKSATRLDYYEIDYVRRLVARAGELVFDWPVAADGGVDPGAGRARFELSGFDPGDGAPRIFDVAGGLRAILDFAWDPAAGTVTFEDGYDGQGQPPRYVISQPSRWKRPAALVRDTQLRLRTAERRADYVVISHADFLDAARRLAAWRARDDRFGPPLQTLVVDVQDIYDEFSGGLLDPMAIRAFVKYAVDNWAVPPVYITLFGDGTYDSKNNSGVSHRNWIPAFQDGESTYDEWYVRLDTDSTPDLAIGRLTVQTPQEAEALVDKMIAYDRDPERGPWQSSVLLVADDINNPQKPQDFESYFLGDAELLARKALPTDLDLIKLYIGAFPLEGRTKPRARDEFIRLFNQGVLILTYLGHGNPAVLAHEQIFLLSRDLGRIDNGRRLPFIYTAASQVGVFDDPARESMPEALVKKPDGGAIGFISATRVGFHNSNMILARQFHKQMYRSGRDHVPVGLALMEAKQLAIITSRDRVNIQRYSLIGDPAQRLSRPRLRVELDLPDTIEALLEVEVEGQVTGPDGAPRSDFDGQAVVRAFDSSAQSQIEGLPYEQVGAPIFRGVVAVVSGRFRTRFRVPKDISYRSSAGRLSAYVTSADSAAAAFGSRSGLVLEGTAEGVRDDGSGPRIAIGFAGQSGFRSGDFVPPQPVLAAVLSDPAGINITGETGHEIELWVDGAATVVTQAYTSQGDYRQGVVRFPLASLDPGEHTLRLKAWDAFNNSAEAEAVFVVTESAAAALGDVLFHPNPSPDGRGDFVYTLRVPATRVHIGVYALSGRRLADLEGDTGLGYNQVGWSPSGLASGTYLYRLEADLEAGGTARQDGWIQILR